MTPVMLTDSTGYAPEWIRNIGGWFTKHIFSPVSEWLNAVPDNYSNGEGKNGVLSFVGGWINGLSWMSAGSESIQVANKLGRVWGTFNRGFGVGLKFTGSFIGYSLLVFDIADVWDSNNMNTNGDRLLKSTLMVLEFAFATTVAALVGSMIVASAPVLAIAGVVILGVSISYGMILASQQLYDTKGID